MDDVSPADLVLARWRADAARVRGGLRGTGVARPDQIAALSGLEVYRFTDRPWGLAESMLVRQATFTPATGDWRADQGWVRRFAKVYLEPGESRKVNFSLDRSDLGFVDATNKTVVEPGEFTVMVGGLSESFTLR